LSMGQKSLSRKRSEKILFKSQGGNYAGEVHLTLACNIAELIALLFPARPPRPQARWMASHLVTAGHVRSRGDGPWDCGPGLQRPVASLPLGRGRSTARRSAARAGVGVHGGHGVHGTLGGAVTAVGDHSTHCGWSPPTRGRRSAARCGQGLTVYTAVMAVTARSAVQWAVTARTAAGHVRSRRHGRVSPVARIAARPPAAVTVATAVTAVTARTAVTVDD
jgi:hypothetical protein